MQTSQDAGDGSAPRPDTVSALERGVAVLRCFTETRRVLTSTELSRLTGVDAVLRSRWPEGTALPDEVAVTPAVSPKFPNISIPYGSLVPEKLDGLLAVGRHISCDRNSHGFMREIPQCWLTGQAAGVAAAIAVKHGIEVRNVDIDELQQALLDQGVYLRPRKESATAVAAKEQACA